MSLKPNEPSNPTDQELTITRVFDAPVALLFRAFTDPARMMRWWGPRGFTTLSCDVDLRVGGPWRVRSRSPEGAEHAEQGAFREIVEAERLVFTHSWEDSEGNPTNKTLVTITFKPEGEKTRLTFHQHGFNSIESRDGHEEGWSSAFELLTEYIVELDQQNIAAQGDEPSGDEAQLRHLFDTWAESLRTKDLDAIMATYAPDTLSYDLAPPLLYRGTPIVRGNLEGWLRTFDGPVGLEVQDFRLTVGGEVAYSTGLQRITGRRTDGDHTDVWVRATVCYRKLDGCWKVAHEHTSVPFYMDDSNKAATDLRP